MGLTFPDPVKTNGGPPGMIEPVQVIGERVSLTRSAAAEALPPAISEVGSAIA